MDNIYQKMTKSLECLKLNETQMSEQQLIKYALQLESLRKKIAIDANQILYHFCLSGMLVLKNEPPAVKKRLYVNIQKAIDDEISKGELKRLGNILFQTYSLDMFLEAACDLRNKITYQAYVPYWISKCEKRKAPKGCGIEGETWYNPIIDMFWHKKLRIWISATEVAWCTYPPPPTK